MKLLDSDVDVERLFLRKRVMSHIVNVVLVKKLLIDNPWCIWNDFIHPSAHGERIIVKNVIQIISWLGSLWALIFLFLFIQFYTCAISWASELIL